MNRYVGEKTREAKTARELEQHRELFRKTVWEPGSRDTEKGKKKNEIPSSSSGS